MVLKAQIPFATVCPDKYQRRRKLEMCVLNCVIWISEIVLQMFKLGYLSLFIIKVVRLKNFWNKTLLNWNLDFLKVWIKMVMFWNGQALAPNHSKTRTFKIQTFCPDFKWVWQNWDHLYGFCKVAWTTYNFL